MTDNTELEPADEAGLYTEEFQYVLGMDPGGTTGIAMLRYTEHTAPELIYLHQIEDGKEGFFEWFNGTTSEGLEANGVTPVSEKWKTREGIHSADLTPVYIEGVQYALWQDYTVYQTPDMKSLVKDEWLKEQNLWTPGKRHQMDALIHAFVYLRSQGHKPTLEALSGKETAPLEEEGGAEAKQLDPEAMKKAAEEAAEAARKVQEIMEAAAEAAKAAAEAAEAAQEAAEGDGDEAGEPGEGEGEGEAAGAVSVPGQGGGDEEGPTGPGNQHGYGKTDKFEGTRKRRTRNGAFMGYSVDEE